MPRTSKPRSRVQKVRGGLKGFADARKPAVELLRDIRTHVVAEGIKNSGVGRESHKIHVSEVVKDTACPRHLYYKVTEEPATDPPAATWSQLESMWAAGHDAHRKWQRWLQEMGDLWGTWFCLQCEHSWEDISPKACVKCGGVLLRYDEVNLEDAGYLVVGHADGAVPRLNAFVEIKSFSVGTVRIDNPKLVMEHTHKIDGRTVIDQVGLWTAIKRPLKSHLKQGMFYLWLAKRMGLPYDKMIYIYENKTTQATKTFEVALSERVIKDEVEVLDEVFVYVADGIAPPRPKLYAPDAKPCKECIFRTGCWSDDSSQSPAVPTGGSRPGGEAPGGEAALRVATPSEAPVPGDSRGHHGPRRSRPDRDDDAPDKVGRAPRRAVGNGRGGRAVGRRSDGEGEGPRFPRRSSRRN
jgi:CRISPR/Cas system-associated exonuclease Cas4 (RecB family)